MFYVFGVIIKFVKHITSFYNLFVIIWTWKRNLSKLYSYILGMAHNNIKLYYFF